jgi:hypothetical protein
MVTICSEVFLVHQVHHYVINIRHFIDCLEQLGKLKKSTLLGLDPTTFWLVA